jgi:hypothetical protein
MIAHVRFSCAGIRLARGGIEKGEEETIFKELAESFAINKKLQRPDGIAMTGLLLGQFLAARGQTDDAVKVLDDSAAAFEKLGMTAKAAEAIELKKQIQKNAGQ